MKKHLFALHCVYLPRINRSLKQFKEVWNCHALRTERGKTPTHSWCAEVEVLGVDLFEDISDEYGESEEGGSL